MQFGSYVAFPRNSQSHKSERIEEIILLIGYSRMAMRSWQQRVELLPLPQVRDVIK
jgi:hypothetical protein